MPTSSRRRQSDPSIEVLYNTAVQSFVRRDHSKTQATLSRLLSILPPPKRVWCDFGTDVSHQDQDSGSSESRRSSPPTITTTHGSKNDISSIHQSATSSPSSRSEIITIPIELKNGMTRKASCHFIPSSPESDNSISHPKSISKNERNPIESLSSSNEIKNNDQNNPSPKKPGLNQTRRISQNNNNNNNNTHSPSSPSTFHNTVTPTNQRRSSNGNFKSSRYSNKYETQDLNTTKSPKEEFQNGEEWLIKTLKLLITSRVSMYTDPPPSIPSKPNGGKIVHLDQDLLNMLPPTSPDIILKDLEMICKKAYRIRDTTLGSPYNSPSEKQSSSLKSWTTPTKSTSSSSRPRVLSSSTSPEPINQKQKHSKSNSISSERIISNQVIDSSNGTSFVDLKNGTSSISSNTMSEEEKLDIKDKDHPLPPTILSTILLASIKLKPSPPALSYAHQLAEDWLTSLPDTLFHRHRHRQPAFPALEKMRLEAAWEGYMRVLELFCGEILTREGEWGMARGILQGDGLMGIKRKENLYRHIRNMESRSLSSPSSSIILPTPTTSPSSSLFLQPSSPNTIRVHNPKSSPTNPLPSKLFSPSQVSHGERTSQPSRRSSSSSSSSERTARPVIKLPFPVTSLSSTSVRNPIQNRTRSSQDTPNESLLPGSLSQNKTNTSISDHEPSETYVRDGSQIGRTDSNIYSSSSFTSLLSRLIDLRNYSSNYLTLFLSSRNIAIFSPLLIILLWGLNRRNRNKTGLKRHNDLRRQLERVDMGGRGWKNWFRWLIRWWIGKFLGVWEMGTKITYL
ncbi:hypothetical protein M231_03768 [Tremella mesenterica]|uniref:Uncharacterized protein n=1 Tax=Tremella mesenterica TaxID=5217 RepID=A0A4Q1BM85_TREME|nr:hypothetical protein M231_03768 [Tremella mesenterica]